MRLNLFLGIDRLRRSLYSFYFYILIHLAAELVVELVAYLVIHLVVDLVIHLVVGLVVDLSRIIQDVAESVDEDSVAVLRLHCLLLDVLHIQIEWLQLKNLSGVGLEDGLDIMEAKSLIGVGFEHARDKHYK